MAKTAHPSGANRRFLFLQGPHGPFFALLSRALSRTRAECWRVGFNGGDRFFAGDRSRFIAYRGSLEVWKHVSADILASKSITDLVIYGDSRPVHSQAIEVARRHGINIHVFEEGYIRPWWVSYERDGSNGNSRLMSLSIEDMDRSITQTRAEVVQPPSHWGDMREHIFYGALYHAAVLAGSRPGVVPHRGISVAREFRLHLRKLLLMPLHWADRTIATRRVMRVAFPYHLVLLQLEHDANFQAFSPFESLTVFLRTVIDGFAEGAPPHHQLVFKAHPLEDGRIPLRQTIRQLAVARNVAGRVHFVAGGKLARLLDATSSVVTVNSTAAQQALLRGIPVKAFGTSVYSKPELVSNQSLRAFLAAPDPPDRAAYETYRRFLLETSQVPGGFYSARGRSQLLRRVVDMMLDPRDPYARCLDPGAAAGQQLRLIR